MDSTKTIPWSMAWNHVAGTSSYWIGIVSVIVVGLLAQFIIAKIENHLNKDLPGVKLAFGVLAVIALVFAVMASPSNIAANTNYAMAAKNIWIY